MSATPDIFLASLNNRLVPQSQKSDATTGRSVNRLKADALRAKLFADWLALHQIQVLNVAGDRESNSPGIEEFVFRFLTGALPG